MPVIRGRERNIKHKNSAGQMQSFDLHCFYMVALLWNVDPCCIDFGFIGLDRYKPVFLRFFW